MSLEVVVSKSWLEVPDEADIEIESKLRYTPAKKVTYINFSFQNEFLKNNISVTYIYIYIYWN